MWGGVVGGEVVEGWGGALRWGGAGGGRVGSCWDRGVLGSCSARGVLIDVFIAKPLKTLSETMFSSRNH